MRIRLYLLALLAAVAFPAMAQTPDADLLSRDNLRGICRVYPDAEQPCTPPPKGYKPFYISHLGRHGSRFLTTADSYDRPLALLEEADSLGVLTPVGKSVLSDVRILCADARGRAGELTHRGEAEHRHIIERMYNHYPRVFKGKDRKVDVQSSARVRSLMSGVFAAERLKEFNPSLAVSRCAAPLNWDEIFVLKGCASVKDSLVANGFISHARTAGMIRPERLYAALFTDSGFLTGQARWRLFYDLYYLAVDTMAADREEIDLFRIFTPEEVYPLWEYDNARFFYRQCNSRKYGRQVLTDAVKPLRRMIEEADAAIAGSGYAAHLRYGHDQNVGTLGALMGIHGSGSQPERNEAEIPSLFRTAETVPMAANIQLVFFRKKNAPVRVKVLLNEKEAELDLASDCWPFYRWEDLKTYFLGRIDTMTLAGGKE